MHKNEDKYKDFSRYIAKFGTGIQEEKIDDRSSQLLQDIRGLAESYWPRSWVNDLGFDYYCGYFESPYANALAMKRNGTHWIGLSSPLIFTASELAICVAGEMDLPKDIEDGEKPSVVYTGTPGFRFGAKAFALDENDTRPFFDQIYNWPTLRKRVANIVYSELLLLVMRHEMFHAVLGHCGFLETAWGIRELTERPRADSGEGEETILACQRTLEFHADWAAYGSVLRMLRSGFDPIGEDISKQYGREFRFGLTTISASLLPIVFAVEEGLSSTFPQTHPSAAARLLTFASRITEFESDPDLHQVWRKATQWAFDTLAMLGTRVKGFEGFHKLARGITQHRAQEERLELIERFDQLQESLAPFALLPLGDPHQGSLELLEGGNVNS